MTHLKPFLFEGHGQTPAVPSSAYGRAFVIGEAFPAERGVVVEAKDAGDTLHCHLQRSTNQTKEDLIGCIADFFFGGSSPSGVFLRGKGLVRKLQVL